jgi:hypothetical protein
MPFTVAEFHDLVRLVEERPEWRAELRRLVLTDELLALPEQVARLRHDTEQGFQQLAAQVAGLTAAQARTEEQLVTLSQAQARTEAELRWLVSWQRGEAGRRDGERYERDILRQAPALLNGGQGGATDHPDVQQRLTAQLGPLLAGDVFDATDNPLLADLVWWKGEQMAVVAVSLQVDRQDVGRAERRAATLRRSGAPVMALVIGEQWATPEAREQAQTRQVDWKVGADLSQGFLALRQRYAGVSSYRLENGQNSHTSTS